MISVLRELRLSYAVLWEGRRVRIRQDRKPPRPRFAHDQIVGLCVPFADMAVRDRVKQAGGTWNSERRVWQLHYDRVVALGLHSRIVGEPASNSRCPGSSGENLHADARAPSR